MLLLLVPAFTGTHHQERMTWCGYGYGKLVGVVCHGGLCAGARDVDRNRGTE